METTMGEPVQVYVPESTSLEFDLPFQAQATWNDDPLGVENEYPDETEEKFQSVACLIKAEEFHSDETDQGVESISVVEQGDSVINSVFDNLTEHKVDFEEYPVRIKDEIKDELDEKMFQPHEYNFKVEDDYCEEEVDEYLMEPFCNPLNNNTNGIEDCENVNSKFNNLDKKIPNNSSETVGSFKLITSLKSSIQNRYRELSLPKLKAQSNSETIDQEPPTVSEKVVTVKSNNIIMGNISINSPTSSVNLEPKEKEVVFETSTSIEEDDLCTDFDINMKVPFNCHLCKRGFLQMDDFISHIKVHKTESNFKNPYICDICQKRFVLKRGLTRHNFLVHNSTAKLKAPFICDQCNQGFFVEFDLISHKFEHELDASLTIKYSHDLREDQLSQKKSLEVYNMINPFGKKNQKKNFVCTKCTRRFLRIKELISHMQIHDSNSEAKTIYACKLCPYQFSTNGSLRRHYTLYHKNNPNDQFPCEV